MHARYAVHARTFFLSDFVSIENKGMKILIPKLKVASSILVARSKFQPFRNHRMQVRNKKRADVAGAFFV
jgi:hypothetical protein